MSAEPRRIRKIVRRGNTLLTPEEMRNTLPAFPDVPAGQSRRGAIATQKVHAYALQKVRVIEGCVTLTQLAVERGIQAQLARLWIKNAGIKKPAGGRWVWKEGSNTLRQVRIALGLRT